ncbi:hypothetical protein JQ554_16060 [Bradyrhizobium diazoefficiens]|nr:hypothetical protein [Bradyrhizobium diazoefficiens]MBR0965601.1 hypothetical protein [Bradyrhizobium diazoefficiens]MBR0979293.1 hypothetical protein [Bradyrhizobium diazoefficiens]MBR1008685.1 hypothetical protein [Bradyrhizobium diazoefficiens]MBR1014766.1 hypothetical protein [Bradyrhizobium diazoefficiens]MBR1052646.1 hypothetical protein [Bradyrhizobium diazoefficiens]
MSLKKPADPLADRIGDGLQLLFRYRKCIVHSHATAVEKSAKHTSTMQDRFEIDELENFLTRFAVEGEPNQSFSDLNDGAGGQVVELIAVHHNVLSKIAIFEPAIRGNGGGSEEYLPKWSAGNGAAYPIWTIVDEIHTCE